ncbi:hypothetical protein C8C84_1329 [Flavobacterium sp. 102]|nr:hypothetical protein C8C84_1329 [Flavobacterium sp. 102]
MKISLSKKLLIDFMYETENAFIIVILKNIVDIIVHYSQYYYFCKKNYVFKGM